LHILILIALLFLSGTLEGLGVSAIIPLFSFINKERGGASDLVSKTIEKSFLFLGIPYSQNSILIIMVSSFIVGAVILFFANYFTSYITAVYERKTREKLLILTLRAGWPHLLKQKLGYLNQILTLCVGNSSGLLFYISSTILVIVNIIIYSLVAINISFVATLIALTFGMGVFLVFKPLMYKGKIIGEKVADLYKQLAHYINETILGIRTIKSSAVEVRVIDRGKEHFGKMQKLNLKDAFFRNIINVSIRPLGLILVIVLFIFSSKFSVLNYASFGVIVYAIYKLFSYIQLLQTKIYGLSSLAPYLSDILQYKKELLENLESCGGVKFFEFKKCLEFRNVSFSYNSDREVLMGLNFSVNKGEMVGLIGPSGSGKTTISDLLLRLLVPQGGEILIDGENASNINIKEWRNNIGYVSQDIFLMNDTVYNNIKFYDDSIGNKEAEEAAKMANIYDFIESCPNKFETIIGERGILLSAGERQRIVIARVLAKKPKFLILDEATSALDNESEVQIQKVIEGLRGKITVLAIAHRLSTIINCDRLLVLGEGKIIEQGKPQELLENKGGYFHKVYNIRSESN